MSSPASSKHGPYLKPQPDIYTVLLVIALVAIMLACLFLYLEVASYPGSPPWSGGPAGAARLQNSPFPWGEETSYGNGRQSVSVSQVLDNVTA